MKLKLISFLLIAFLPSFAYAECTATYCAEVTIEELYVNANGNIFVATSGDESKLTCTTVSGGGTHITLRTADSNYKEIYSALLASQRAGKKMDIRTDDQNGCNIVYIRSKL